MMILSPRFTSALVWLTELYQNDVRKVSGAPTIHHPLGVCELVQGAGWNEETAIGALFHDLGEDKGGLDIIQKIEDNYGTTVARIVRDCSDTLPTDYSEKEPWVLRKVEHIRHIPKLDADSCAVLAADSLHNVRDHIRGIRFHGDDWWNNFRANVYLDKERTNEIGVASALWYLRNKSHALLKRKDDNSILAIELGRATSELFDVAGAKYLHAFAEASIHVEEKYGELVESN